MNKIIALGLLLFMSVNTSAQSTDQPNFKLPTLYNDDGNGFVVIAHRGASAYYPENTMAAFKGAVEMDAEMIELDIMLSRDGVPVVFHDATLDDHTDGNGKLEHYTLEQLKQLDAGAWRSPRFSGQRIPTLEEVLEFARGKIALNIEIKTEAVTDNLKGGVEEKAIKLVRKYDMEDHVLFSSFDYRAVSHLKELAPDIPAALLYSSPHSGNMLPSELLQKYGADAFNCHYSELTRKRLRDIRENEIPVFVYTVNRKRRMRKLIKMGVRGIFSDKPDVLRQVANKLTK